MVYGLQGWLARALAVVGLVLSTLVGAAALEAGELGAEHAYFVEVARLRTQYLQALQRLEARMVDDADIDNAVAVRRELNRFRRNHQPPDMANNRARPARLLDLQRIYVNQIAKLDGELASAKRGKRAVAASGD